MASVRTIARHAGVSIATVSRVLNGHPQVSEDVKKRVLAATSDAGYVPTVGKRSTSNIGVLYTGELSLGSPFDSSVLQGMSEGLRRYAYDLLVLSAARGRLPGESWSQMLLRKAVAGIVIRTDEPSRDLCREIAAEGIAAVVLADDFGDPAITCLRTDAQRAVRQAMEHLLHLGHRRIAITLNVVDDHDHRERLDVYRQSLRDAGLGLDEDLILRVPAYQDAGRVCLRQVMGMPRRPTAVFVTDPMAAMGLFHEAQRMGVRIPNDLSVIGFDDSQQRLGVYPRMSAVCQDAERLGSEAMSLLARVVDHRGDRPAIPKLECWLELNESTAAVTASN